MQHARMQRENWSARAPGPASPAAAVVPIPSARAAARWVPGTLPLACACGVSIEVNCETFAERTCAPPDLSIYGLSRHTPLTVSIIPSVALVRLCRGDV